jgi:hypothetical protein
MDHILATNRLQVETSKKNNDTIDTCNISEIDERPRVEKVEGDNFLSINLFSSAFKDIKLNSLSTDKAAKPLPTKQGAEYIYKSKTLKPKNLVNDLPCFFTKSGHHVLNSISFPNRLYNNDPNIRNSSNFSNESQFDSMDMTRKNGYGFLQSHSNKNCTKK